MEVLHSSKSTSFYHLLLHFWVWGPPPPRFDVCSLVSACINDRLEQKYIHTFLLLTKYMQDDLGNTSF